MISLAIYVNTLSSCTINTRIIDPIAHQFMPECIVEFIRISKSSATAKGEIARPICDWINHKWIDRKYKECEKDYSQPGSGTDDCYYDIELWPQRCLFCNRVSRRIVEKQERLEIKP